MNLYRIYQDVQRGYDTYDSAVVAAESEEAARLLHPDGLHKWSKSKGDWGHKGTDGLIRYDNTYGHGSWAPPENVGVELIGTAEKPEGVICASFNAG